MAIRPYDKSIHARNFLFQFHIDLRLDIVDPAIHAVFILQQLGM